MVNPDPNGMNTSDYVGSYIRNGGEENDVIVGRLASPLAIGTANNYSLQVWDENPPTNVVLSLQKDGVPVQDITATTSATNSWETIIFAGGGTTAEEINEVVILFDPGNFSSGQYFFDNLELTGTIAVEELPGVAAFQVFPNPSAGLTNFEFELERSAEVQLSIYDLNGRQIGQILNGSLSAGQHQASWDAAQAADGLYYYTLTVDGALSTGKIALQR
ncbi:MAG: T9SS type A sorting domain-containing protein [Saprospiraceae bacterium]|nr:T9SS type A sorting domain-containing protein [Saprospiraceae bacterium]